MQKPDEHHDKLSTNNRSNKGKITRRYFVFAEHLIAGKSAAESARLAGFSNKIGREAWRWIRHDRADSSKPELWDYWRKRSDEQFRILGATSENIIRELCGIAFSSIDRFVKFPSVRDGIDPTGINFNPLEDDENDSKSWSKFRPGSEIQLRFAEEIPAELMPAVESVAQTKHGIRIKLHSKIDALDKLARIRKMYADLVATDEPADYQINISISGSKSPMLAEPSIPSGSVRTERG